MTEDLNKKLSQVGEGKAARLVMSHMQSDLEYQRHAIVSRLKAMHRSGEATEAKLLAGIAELCTLDDLENRLNQKIRRGDNASKEIDDAT